MVLPLTATSDDSVDDFKEMVYESIQEVCFLKLFLRSAL